MPTYRNKETEEYGITERQIKAEYPNTSFPSKFRSPWHDLVFDAPKPTITNLQRVVEGPPEITALGAYQQTWVVVDKFDTQEEIDAFLAQELADTKLRIQTRNKADCKAFILSHYSEETQRNAALGIYTTEVVTAMADHIAAIVAVENATFDLIENSTDPESVPDPVWPEV